MVFNNESLTAETELKSLLSFNPEVARGIRNFWRKTIAASIVGIIVISILIANRQWIDSGREWIAGRVTSNKAQQEIYYSKLEAEREEKRKFQPEQKAVLQDSYVDSIIYTKLYIESQNDETFQKHLISSTNKFFIEELKLDENVVAPFVGAESSLNTQLLELRAKINGEFPQEGIDKMRELENGTKSALVDMIGGDKNFQSYWKFRKKAYSEYLAEKEGREITSESQSLDK